MSDVTLTVKYFYGWMYERNENLGGECRFKTKKEWKWVGSDGMLVCNDTVCLQRVVDEFCGVCTKRKLKMNAEKSREGKGSRVS